MRPSMPLRANCASSACALCTLPKTSPDSASKAWRAPGDGLSQHREDERIGARACIERTGNRDADSASAQHRPIRNRATAAAVTIASSVRKTLLSVISESGGEKGQVACHTAEPGVVEPAAGSQDVYGVESANPLWASTLTVAFRQVRSAARR